MYVVIMKPIYKALLKKFTMFSVCNKLTINLYSELIVPVIVLQLPMRLCSLISMLNGVDLAIC